MISNYKVKVNDSCNYKVSITDIQNKYKFKLFCAGADLTDYYTKEQVDQSQNTQDILIDNILNQIPTGTATGETINITDSSSLPIKDIQEAGNTYQADAILPNEYTQVDYIKSSGTQYIDTGFKPNQNTRMIANVYINSLVGQYNNIGGTRASNTKQFHIIIASDRFDARYGTQGSTISYTTTGLFNFDFNKNQLYINNSLAHTFTDNTFSSDYNAYIFAVNNTGSATQMADYKLYNMKWYDNDTLVRDFIPCYRNSDNEVGLYDLVNNVFYVNQGTGSFTYGSVASIPNPDYPQTISNVTGTSTITIANSDSSQSQNYTINLGSIELCKIGDYKDRIYYSSGKWYLEKNIGKVTLNGSESWNSWYNVGNNIGFYYNNSSLAVIGVETALNGALYCNKFSETPLRTDIVYGNAEAIKQCGGTGNQYIALGVNKTRLSDYSTKALAISSLKSWLSSNNVYYYYVLATPTTTEITDTTLVGQLDTLLNSTTYKTTTNITIDTTNQKPTLTLTYRKDLETLIGG